MDKDFILTALENERLFLSFGGSLSSDFFKCPFYLLQKSFKVKQWGIVYVTRATLTIQVMDDTSIPLQCPSDAQNTP